MNLRIRIIPSFGLSGQNEKDTCRWAPSEHPVYFYGLKIFTLFDFLIFKSASVSSSSQTKEELTFATECH
jgi:hypothetical protein